MKKNYPLSYVMAVHNTEKYLEKTLDSALSQIYSDFELICVNDGSTDASLEILKKFEGADKRISVLSFEENKGVSGALNAAINHAKGKIIGILDSDDLYLPEKTGEQMRFLAAHEDYAAVGSSMLRIDETDRVYGWESMPSSDTAMRWRMLFNSPFLQPSVLMRKAALSKLDYIYRNDYKAAVDYELWVRLLKLGKGYNFKEPFLLYRRHKNSVSNSRNDEQIKNRDEICGRLISECFGNKAPTQLMIDRIRQIFVNKPRFFDSQIKEYPEIPTKGEVCCYFSLLGKFARKLPRKEARRFLHEEQQLLGHEYLARLGLQDINFYDRIYADKKLNYFSFPLFRQKEEIFVS